MEILNPTLPKEEIEEKESVLDLVVQLKDKSKIDIEMRASGKVCKLLSVKIRPEQSLTNSSLLFHFL